MENKNTPPKTVGDFLREAAIGLQEGDTLSLKVSAPYDGGDVFLIKSKPQVAVWIMPQDRFWSFWQRVEDLKKHLGQK